MTEFVVMKLFMDDDLKSINENVLEIVKEIIQSIEDLSTICEMNTEYGITESTGANVSQYFEITVTEYSEKEFMETFRMSRIIMQALIEHLKSKSIQSHKVPLEKEVHLTVWLLANKDSYREAGNLFGLHKSTVSYVFQEMCELIADCRHEFIRWPTREIQNLTKNIVMNSYNFPNCVGFIDGCHIQLKEPKNNPTDFYNRKDTHSFVLQGVCDDTLKFIDIFLGQTGRAHDARVFRESPLSERIYYELIEPENHLLGDSAYTLQANIMTPYRDNGQLSEVQIQYNTVHAKARAYIERTFGRLKGKFRRLKYLEINKTENISIVICAACVIHNFIIIHEQENADTPINIQGDDITDEMYVLLFGLSPEEKRTAICENLNK